MEGRAAEQLTELFERLDARPGGDGLCLEIGCGTGRMTVELAPFLAEIARVLAPGGAVFVQLPLLERGGRARARRLARALMPAWRGRIVTARSYRGVRITRGELDRALARAGLRVTARSESVAPTACAGRYPHSVEVLLRLER